MKEKFYTAVFLIVFALSVSMAQISTVSAAAAPVVRTETSVFRGNGPVIAVRTGYKIRVSARSVYKKTGGKGSSTKNKKAAARYSRCLRAFRSRIKYR